MARLSQAFVTEEAPDRRDMDPIPRGTVAVAKIIDADVVPAKSGRGEILKLTWQLEDGPHAGRQLWTRINYLHENQTAQDIGQGELKEINRALGIGTLTDSEDLKFKPVRITIGIEKSKDANYPDSNKVTKVEAIGGAPTGQRQTNERQPPASRQTSDRRSPPPDDGRQRPWR